LQEQIKIKLKTIDTNGTVIIGLCTQVQTLEIIEQSISVTKDSIFLVDIYGLVKVYIETVDIIKG